MFMKIVEFLKFCRSSLSSYKDEKCILKNGYGELLHFDKSMLTMYK